jgi:pimeloyl-ACP methyl ester carboxylesterase
MGNLKIGWLAVGVLAIAFVVVVVLVYARYRRDMRSARERLESGGSQVVETDCLPVNPRADGAVFDMFVSNTDINSGYPLEEITVPVLIVSAVDDPLTLYANAKAAAERIPGAKLVTIEDSGHMLLGHQERVRSEIVTFLAGVLDE